MSFKNNFGDWRLLTEGSEAQDLIGVESEVKRLNSALEAFAESDRNSIIAYVAPFGAGKSLILDCVQKQTDYEWLTFETWRYSNRNELWDNFTVETVAYFTKKSLSKIADEVDGGAPSNYEKWIGILIVVGIIVITLASRLVWEVYKEDAFLVAWLKYALPLLISGLGFLGLTTMLSWSRRLKRSNKMTRVFQFEERLKSAFSTADRPVVIVVDDADRAGEDGMVFLETLRTFLNNNNFINPIVVIVPQSRYAFDTKSVSRGIRSIDRAMKLYDTTIYFYPQVSGYDFEKYYKNLKINDEYAIKQLTRISSILAGDYGMKRIGYDGQINLRLFKYALRESALFLEYYPKAKLHLAFIFILSRLITTPENEPAASKLKNREFDDHWLLPFMVAIYDEEGKWKPGEVYHYLIFFGDYGKDKEIKIKVYGKTVEINIDKKYEQLIDLP